MNDSDPYKCACVILAAGGSRRLGTSKQSLRLAGETLIHRSARLALEAEFSPVCVVLGSAADLVRAELQDCPVLCIENNGWEAGMSTSLRAGIAAVVGHHPDLGHALIMVCDQPRLSLEILQRLRTRSCASPDRIIASHYAGRLGVPAIFPARYFYALLAIDGDRGARHVMNELREWVIAVEFPEGAVDVDTPEDVDRAGLTR